MIESGVPQVETAASPFPLSSDDDEYDSSSNGQQKFTFSVLQTIFYYNESLSLYYMHRSIFSSL